MMGDLLQYIVLIRNDIQQVGGMLWTLGKVVGDGNPEINWCRLQVSVSKYWFVSASKQGQIK